MVNSFQVAALVQDLRLKIAVKPPVIGVITVMTETVSEETVQSIALYFPGYTIIYQHLFGSTVWSFKQN